jgi:hypothetical protein
LQAAAATRRFARAAPRADQPNDRGFIGEDADDVGAPNTTKATARISHQPI